MSFNPPNPEEGHIYYHDSDNSKLKVVRVILESEKVEYVILDEKNEEAGTKKRIDSSKWNSWNLKDITDSNKNAESTKSSEDSNNTQSNIYTFEFSDEGILSIKKEGKAIEHFNLRGTEGKPGRDGMPGQDGIPGQKGQDGIPGKPGTDGAIGQQGSQGESGIQGAPGSSGRDGETWTPLITDDGNFLYFINSKGDETNRFPIRGAKGDQGAEGIQGKQGEVGPVFMPNVSSDGNLSWSSNGKELSNPTSVNIKGDQGKQGESGITFHPLVKDGVLYWINDRGVDNPTPVRITGPQGIQGDKGESGSSAYQIWLNDGNWGTQKDFLESLIGEQGVPAPPADFSFKDVEDFTCPIQKINTKLITGYNDLYNNRTPEEIIDERIKKIEDLREQGEQLIKKDKKGEGHEGYRKNNWFKESMWWCAGADRRLLRMCPGDHSKYVGLGTVIFFTALMAWFSSFIAMKLVFQNETHGNLYAGIFATCWALMIFFLDRFITNTMYSDGKVTISKQELLSGLPRIAIAIFLGIVISAPLELEIFKGEINTEININIKYQKIKEVKRHFDDDISKLKDALNSLKTEKLKRIDNVRKISAIDEQITTERSEKSTSLSTAAKKIIRMNPHKDNQAAVSNGNEQYAKDRANMENIVGKKYNDNIRDLLTQKLDYPIDTLEVVNRIKEVNKQLQQIENQKEDSINKFCQNYDKNTRLLTKLQALHSIGMKGYEPWSYDEEPDSIEDNKINKGILNIFTSKTDSIKTAEKEVSENKKTDNKCGAKNNKILAALDIIFHAWWWFLFNSSIGLIMFLFILIDISPVLYKMMLADGRYDNYLHQEKLLAQDKIRLSLAKILKKLDESDLKRVAPFIMGNIYEKMADESFIFKTEEEYSKEIEKKYNEDKNWFERLFSKKVPKVPAIIFTLKGQNELDKKLDDVNKKIFEEVLDMKKRIILASYRRWYKTQHDSIICDPVDDENAGKEPFDNLDDSKEEKTDKSSNNKNTKAEDSAEYNKDPQDLN